MLQENCPRVFTENEINKKVDFIKEKASNHMFDHLLDMEESFSSGSIVI